MLDTRPAAGLSRWVVDGTGQIGFRDAQRYRQVLPLRKLRREMSLPEVLLWMQLQKRPGGHKFRKQFPQANFVIDFACVAARLAIEVDGEAHDRGDQPAFDQRRDELLRERGFTVLRFPAHEVLKNRKTRSVG